MTISTARCRARGYEDIERFDCFFSEALALERGEYGNVFYAFMGTNPCEKVYKVTVERAKARALCSGYRDVRGMSNCPLQHDIDMPCDLSAENICLRARDDE